MFFVALVSMPNFAIALRWFFYRVNYLFSSFLLGKFSEEGSITKLVHDGKLQLMAGPKGYHTHVMCYKLMVL